jgi:ADP-ribose pyrophosphatase
MATFPSYPGLVIESDDTVWTGRTRLDVVKFRHPRFDGGQSPTRTWEVWHRGDAVGLLPYDPTTDQVVMIEQFRLPALAAHVDPVMLEIPGGFMDEGENAMETAVRETREEMRLTADRLELFGRFVLTAGGADETATIFAGRVTAPAVGPDGIAGFAGLASENEDIRIRVLPAAAVIADVQAGAYPNSITTMALLWFALKRDWLRERWAS